MTQQDSNVSGSNVVSFQAAYDRKVEEKAHAASLFTDFEQAGFMQHAIAGTAPKASGIFYKAAVQVANKTVVPLVSMALLAHDSFKNRQP